MKKKFKAPSPRQMRSFLYILGLINIGICLHRWSLINLVLGLTTIAIVSTIKDK